MASYSIYRANKSGTGSATKLEARAGKLKEKDDLLVFLQSAKQGAVGKNGFATFEWKDDKKSISFKLEEIDIGHLLSVLTGERQNINDGKGAYHQTTKGNSTLKLSRAEDGNYFFSLSKKVGADPLVEIKHGISSAEGQVWRVFLEDILKEKLYKTNYIPRNNDGEGRIED